MHKLKIALVLGVSMAFLAACGGNQQEPAPAPEPTPQEETAPAETPATGDTQNVATELITEDQAKEIALAHAQVNAADAQFDKVELDTDDGRQEYDIEFYVGNMEYEYEIDAVTGDILSSEQDNR